MAAAAAATGGAAGERWEAYGNGGEHYIVLFYKYAEISDPEAEVALQSRECHRLGLTGRVFVAPEGINATVGGSKEALEEYVNDVMRTRAYFADIDFKGSSAAGPVFPDLHVSLRREICSTGMMVPAAWKDGAPQPGVRLAPEDYHKLIADSIHADGSLSDDMALLDCRNLIESAIGSFAGAEPIPMNTFAEFPAWVDRNLDRLRGKKRVAMFCTGGIRCEKASAFLKARLGEGPEVFHLSGGIHRYMERFSTPETAGLWRGKNFVFDQRVAMGPADCVVPHPGATATAAAAEAGEEAEGGADVPAPSFVGRCQSCGEEAWTLTGAAVCDVCRVSVLACDACTRRHHHVYWCPNHEHLRGKYYYWLDPFTVEELEAQKAALEEEAARLTAERDAMVAEARQARASAARERQAAMAAAAAATAATAAATAATAAAGGAEAAPDAGAAADGAAKPPSTKERRRQRKQALREPGKSHPGRHFRHKLRTLTQQVRRIDERLEALRSGAAALPAERAERPPCRTCHKEACSGNCWGFWRPVGSADGEVEIRRGALESLGKTAE